MKQKAKPYLIGLYILLILTVLLANHLHPVPYDKVPQWCPISEKQAVVISVIVSIIVTAIEALLEAHKKPED